MSRTATHRWLPSRRKASRLHLVGLKLVPGVPDGCVVVQGAFDFEGSDWQAIDEGDDVGPTVVGAFDDGELVHYEPVVLVGIVADQPGSVASDGAIGAAMLDFDAVAQHPVKGAVVDEQCW